MRNAAGVNFGIGPEADKLFWVEIEVSSGTETPDLTFALAYETINLCSAQSTIIIKIENTGSIRLDSAEITLRNLADDSVIFGPESGNEPFLIDSNGCPPGGSRVKPGVTKYLGAKLSSLPPSGTNVRGIVKACSEEDLGGTCAEETTDFTIP